MNHENISTKPQKLELEVNQPTEVELLYDEPVIGESQYGEYRLYGLLVNGERRSYFAPEAVHERLEQYRKGDKLLITKHLKWQGNSPRTWYEVELTEESEETKYVSETGEITTRDKEVGLFEIMLTSLREGVKIAKELDGIVDATKVGITLFIARSKSTSLI